MRALLLKRAAGRDADFLDKFASDLSGGEAQIAALVPAAARAPDRVDASKPRLLVARGIGQPNSNSPVMLLTMQISSTMLYRTMAKLANRWQRRFDDNATGRADFAADL